MGYPGLGIAVAGRTLGESKHLLQFLWVYRLRQESTQRAPGPHRLVECHGLFRHCSIAFSNFLEAIMRSYQQRCTLYRATPSRCAQYTTQQI